jgi:hypothetical protein
MKFIPDIACELVLNASHETGTIPPSSMQVGLFSEARRILQSYAKLSTVNIEAQGGTSNCPLLEVPYPTHPHFLHASVGLDDAIARVTNPGPDAPLINGLEPGTYIGTATVICPATVINIVIVRE